MTKDFEKKKGVTTDEFGRAVDSDHAVIQAEKDDRKRGGENGPTVHTIGGKSLQSPITPVPSQQVCAFHEIAELVTNVPYSRVE
jgi:hypothetical protein